jgi:hypothetical protein
MGPEGGREREAEEEGKKYNGGQPEVGWYIPSMDIE